MTGKRAIDPAHTPVINAGLSTSDADLRCAEEFIEQFNRGGGKPANGSDLPRLHRVTALIAKAQVLGMRDERTCDPLGGGQHRHEATRPVLIGVREAAFTSFELNSSGRALFADVGTSALSGMSGPTTTWLTRFCDVYSC